MRGVGGRDIRRAVRLHLPELKRERFGGRAFARSTRGSLLDD